MAAVGQVPQGCLLAVHSPAPRGLFFSSGLLLVSIISFPVRFSVLGLPRPCFLILALSNLVREGGAMRGAAREKTDVLDGCVEAGTGASVVGGNCGRNSVVDTCSLLAEEGSLEGGGGV